MATEIRVIPTLHGEEAKKFIENAEWTEAHPGKDKLSVNYNVVKDYLGKMNLL